MKWTRSVRRDTEADSNIIEPILMIWITVVLSGVLYVLLIGSGVGVSVTPVGTFTTIQNAGGNNDSLFFSPFTKTVKPSDLEIVIENSTSGVQWTTYRMPSTDLSGALNAFSGGTNVTGIGGVTYTDLAQDKKVGMGDYITIEFCGPRSGVDSYKVSLVYVPTGGYIGSVTLVW